MSGLETSPQSVDLLSSYKARRGVDAVGSVTVGPMRGSVQCQYLLTTGAAPAFVPAGRVTIGVVLVARMPDVASPSPFDPDDPDNFHLDWLYYRTCWLVPEITRAANGDLISRTNVVDQFEFEARAMRRMEELDQKLLFVAGGVSATNDAVSVNAQVSCLLRGEGL